MPDITFGNILNYAYSEMLSGGFNYNRFVFNVENPALFKREHDSNNTFCYDLTIPANTYSVPDIQQYLREDLKRYFNVSVFKEKRKVKCLIITATNKVRKILSKSGKKVMETEPDNIKKFIYNYSINEVIHFLDQFDSPLINETDINKNIDIDFPDHFDLKNKQALLAFLTRIGFSIREEERLLDVVVISNK